MRVESAELAHWRAGLRSWQAGRGPSVGLTQRRLPPLPQPLPFAQTGVGKVDTEIQRLLDLLTPPVRPQEPAPIAPPPPTAQEVLPIGLFLRGIAFSGRHTPRVREVDPNPSCGQFFRFQVDWHGIGSHGSVDLVQLSAWATAEAIDRSRKATIRQFLRQICWSGASKS